MTADRPACPWCSAALRPGAATCQACGAALVADPALEVPGLTTLPGGEPRQRRRPRRGLLGLLLGGMEPEPDDRADDRPGRG